MWPNETRNIVLSYRVKQYSDVLNHSGVAHEQCALTWLDVL